MLSLSLNKLHVSFFRKVQGCFDNTIILIISFHFLSLANKAASLKPEELLRLLLSDCQREATQALPTSCTLHDVQGNFLQLTVEREEEEGGGGDAKGKGANVVLTSHSLLLLAKARMSVVHRLGVSVGHLRRFILLKKKENVLIMQKHHL